MPHLVIELLTAVGVASVFGGFMWFCIKDML